MTEQVAEFDIAEEDRLRAQWYALLARFLSAPPDAATLELARGLAGDGTDLGTDLGKGVKALAAAAKGTTVEAVDEEFFDLFVGVGQGELLPYGSYYLTGFLNEKPLAALRIDMDELGIGRVEDVKEPEDHVASLCEMMAGLITGAFGAPVDLSRQRWFFDKHIGCWAPRFFEDLQATRSAAFYMPVGMIGSVFMSVESQAFQMAA
ncbi:MAG: molecular chaperone TorD family protein [Proteobacteria bacterium]|nr:molecular chaperone TorD family protein [Pseudomonadota bacterium]